MSELLLDSMVQDRWSGLRMIALHAFISLLALAIAFALPVAANYILYRWWPLVTSNADLLLASEIVLAATLTLVFNFWRVAWSNSFKGKVADTAALIYARHGASWLTRFRERSLIRKLPPAHEAFIMTLTGYDTFSSERSVMHKPLQSAYDLRVMLLHPCARGAEKRIRSLPGDVTQQSYVDEVKASIAYLATLRRLGRKVTLKFYEDEPFWKVVVLGGYLWLQYCHGGRELKGDPEYVFAFNRDQPRLGLFVPFYMYFLEHWNDSRHPEYDFDTHELVYRDERGREVRRATDAATGDENESMALDRRA